MSDIKKDVLKKEIASILKDADLNTVSSKKVRKQLEDKLEIDLSDRKKEIDDLVLACVNAKDKKGKKNGDINESSEDEEDEADNDDDDEEDDEEEEEQVKKPKRSAAKKAAPGKRKKGSSDESEESASEKDDDDYSPKKKAAAAKKGGKRGRKKKSVSSDNDSDEDWDKGKKKASKKPGAKRGGGGYTKPVTLSADLAELLGESSMPRHEVVKRIWAIIKERNLYDPKNKQFAICDDDLLKVFGVKRFRTFGMMKFLKNHFSSD